MAAVIGVCTFSVIIILSILIICGLPLGELTMGGRFSVFPKKLRLLLIVKLVLQIFFMVIILQTGGFLGLFFSHKVTKLVGIIMAAYLSLNVIVNAISNSKKEKYIITPLSLVSAICFWITVLKF